MPKISPFKTLLLQPDPPLIFVAAVPKLAAHLTFHSYLVASDVLTFKSQIQFFGQ